LDISLWTAILQNGGVASNFKARAAGRVRDEPYKATVFKSTNFIETFNVLLITSWVC
jgi:hypothetical protein